MYVLIIYLCLDTKIVGLLIAHAIARGLTLKVFSRGRMNTHNERMCIQDTCRCVQCMYICIYITLAHTLERFLHRFSQAKCRFAAAGARASSPWHGVYKEGWYEPFNFTTKNCIVHI